MNNLINHDDLNVDDDDIIELILNNPNLLTNSVYIKRRYKGIIKNRVAYIQKTVFKNFVLSYIKDELLELVNSKTYDEEEKISPLDFDLK